MALRPDPDHASAAKPGGVGQSDHRGPAHPPQQRPDQVRPDRRQQDRAQQDPAQRDPADPGQTEQQPPPPPPQPDPAALAAQKEAQAASSIGAQVILDYNGDGSKGARGGAGATIEENSQARDAHLIALGLDPVNPSGPPTGEPWEPPAPPARKTAPASGQATRVSSLAAGILTGDEGSTEPPPEGGGAAGAPANTTVPQVSQADDTLSCTMGEWSGEPTSYAYQWKIDGADAGTGTETYTVQAADVGKTASCVVTATNAEGSAAAPPSNEVTITDPIARSER